MSCASWCALGGFHYGPCLTPDQAAVDARQGSYSNEQGPVPRSGVSAAVMDASDCD